jgi:hypothetical protein
MAKLPHMSARKAGRKVAARKKAAAKGVSMRAAPESENVGPPQGEMKRVGGKISSLAVNRGHLFALRPRVSAAFRQEDFIAARRLLEGEAYASLEEAARAVAERALSLSNDPKGKRDFRHGR